MAVDGFSIDITDSGVAEYLKKMASTASSGQVAHSLLDGAIILEKHVKKALNDLVYNKPQTWYKRKKGAGLYGSTQATGRLVPKGDEITTGVKTASEIAAYVAFGTGIHAEGGRGRKTPWVYKGEDGEFHYTVGQVPKPFMTVGAKKGKKEIMAIIGKSLFP